MPKGKILMGNESPEPKPGTYGPVKRKLMTLPLKTGKVTPRPKPKPKPTPDPYGFPPAEGFGGYGPDNKLIPMRTPIVKKTPKRVSVTRRGGK